jgi:hypothetical protein
MAIITNGASRIYINSSGNIGIGTTTPSAALEVSGHVYQSGLGSSTFFGNAAGANDDLTYNQNTFIGHSAGNHNTSGFHNTAECFLTYDLESMI